MAAENTDGIRKNAKTGAQVDAMDRKILGALARDASQSFASLGALVGLSAPAVHERVKRLRAAGIIKRTMAVVDGKALGKPLLAFVHVDTIGWGKTPAMMEFAELPEVEEVHSSTGDTCIIMKVRVASSEALEGLLKRLYETQGVRATRTFVALSTHTEKGVRPEITSWLEDEDWPTE
ncbi:MULTISPECIES: Lrp/AsnC family transcriptional regulator [Halocynthiibacter]|uniref:Lrp/AsnC family transcriptional regulator n=1 Tax=Halocynthiibacter halioticoli TaxID=2986804 RepID=A0AAE3IY20_9RHOB|nr:MULTISPECIES: Lrp/AsnC family transcriptional regulator [Halocynthiibacter]MCV6824230.1 Lrp/AsnC family transcriptional regulator [Halocynthiibacter halioticoli]MCW4057231.1 Lrp/AsnC family transcriptional regulator [Halocynthiibacter sp. SDUM655004]MDE0589740.1 Lrp/AsnC family transcriptional regulator [Halocynthiibacter sp. C4]